MGLRIVTAPEEWPVTLEEAKVHLREEADVDDFDAQIQAFIEAATEEAEGFQGRALIDQTWDLFLDRFPCATMDGARLVRAINLPKPPLIEVLGVFYLDSSGAEQTLPDTTYTVDTANEPGRVVLKSGSWPTLPDLPNAVRVRFRAGYLDQTISPPVSSVPSTTRAGILLIVGSLYANRESVVIGQTAVEIPWTAERMLRRKKFDLSIA